MRLKFDQTTVLSDKLRNEMVAKMEDTTPKLKYTLHLKEVALRRKSDTLMSRYWWYFVIERRTLGVSIQSHYRTLERFFRFEFRV